MADTVDWLCQRSLYPFPPFSMTDMLMWGWWCNSHFATMRQPAWRQGLLGEECQSRKTERAWTQTMLCETGNESSVSLCDATGKFQRQDLYPKLPNTNAYAFHHKSTCTALFIVVFPAVHRGSSFPHYVPENPGSIHRWTSEEKKTSVVKLTLHQIVSPSPQPHLHNNIPKFPRNPTTTKTCWTWMNSVVPKLLWTGLFFLFLFFFWHS